MSWAWPFTGSEHERENLLPLHDLPTIETEDGNVNESRSQGPSRRHSRSPSSVSKSIANDFSSLSPSQAADRLRTSLTNGLSSSEAFSRLQNEGPNELPKDAHDPWWMSFLGQFKDPLIMLLLFSAFLSLVVRNTDDAISICVAVTIVVTVATVQEYRSEKSLEALNHLVPNHAHLIRNDSSSTPRSATWPPKITKDAVDEATANTVKDQSGTGLTATKVMAPTLVPGDLVIFNTGDRIPADIRVTEAADLTIDESNLTGENEPVRITVDAKPKLFTRRTGSGLEAPGSPVYASASTGAVGVDTQTTSRTNIAFMGTLVRSGHGKGIVFATGGKTHFGTIAASVKETESPRSPLQLSMDALGAQLSKFSLGVIVVIAFVGWLQSKNLLDVFTISISLAVAAIPEGLPIIVTVTLALGVHRMAKQHAIVRKMPSVETLGSVNVVCSDKTGTLTMNHMTVTKIWHFDAPAPMDVGDEDDLTDKKPDAATLRIMRIGNIANNGRLLDTVSQLSATVSSRTILTSTQDHSGPTDSVKSRWVGQPTDVAMLDLVDRFREHDVRDTLGPRIGETPFSSERKWMGVTIRADTGKDGGHTEREIAYVKGALDRILDRCDTYLTPEGREVVLDSARRQEALQTADKMAGEGLRVLGFASGPASRSTRSKPHVSTPRSSTPVTLKVMEHETGSHEDDVYKGLTFAGIVGMNDPPRYGVAKSIRRLMRGGVRVIMITGDAEATAVAIARKLDMDVPAAVAHSVSSNAIKPVLNGHDIDEMSEEELQGAIAHISVFARTSPDHKMRIVNALQARGDIVAMTGDGVNDAPALKKADIGVSMGLMGTDVAKEAADMILTDDDFSTILHAIEEGKGIFNNIQNFLTFQLSTSAAALTLVFLCTCLGYSNPLNAMQILWINIIMDGPPAQSLGVEPVDKDVMARPPRRRGAPVLTRTLFQRVITSATIVMLGTIAVYIHEMSHLDALDSADMMTPSINIVNKRDTTMTFTCFVLFDMFNALNCRSESKSILRGEIGLFANGLFNWAVSLSLLGQLAVIYLPALQGVFQTEALSVADLFGLILLTSTVFFADEARKWWKYGKKARRGLGGYSQVV